MKKKKTLMIPFDRNGNLLQYVARWMDPKNIVMKENYIFAAVLHYDTFTGNNPPRFHFSDLSGNITYSMSLGEFNRVVQNCDIKDGYVQGHWTFRKHGRTYSLILLPSIYLRK